MFQVQVRAEIFSECFFEQRRIAEFGIPRDTTVEERKRFEEWEREVRDNFLTSLSHSSNRFRSSTVVSLGIPNSAILLCSKKHSENISALT